MHELSYKYNRQTEKKYKEERDTYRMQTEDEK